MRNTYNAVLVMVALLAFAGVARAQNPVEAIPPSAANDNGAKALMQFAANNADFDRIVLDTAKSQYHRQITECQATDQVVRQLPTPYGGITFAAPDGVSRFPPPLNGVWAEHVKIRGCGQSYQINILSIGRAKGGQPLTLALLPGETLSDPGQQGNVLHAATVAIRKVESTCQENPVLSYSRMLGFKQADGSLGKTDLRNGWFEEWTFRLCQKTVPAQIAYIPDGKGGYDIKSRIIGDTPAPGAPASKPAQAPAEKTQQTAPE